MSGYRVGGNGTMADWDVATEIAEKAECLRQMAEQAHLHHLAFILQCCVNTALLGEEVVIERILAEIQNARIYDA